MRRLLGSCRFIVLPSVGSGDETKWAASITIIRRRPARIDVNENGVSVRRS